MNLENEIIEGVGTPIFMEENGFEPYFDLSKVSGISGYVVFWLEKYKDDPRIESKVLEKLKVVFSRDSKSQIKVLDGYKFTSTFLQRIGVKRLQNNLKPLLVKIDAGRYSKVN